MMRTRNALLAAVLAASFVTSAPAVAVPLLTTAVVQNFNFTNLNDSSTLFFSGFDSTLGTLTSVHFEWTLSKTLKGTSKNPLSL